MTAMIVMTSQVVVTNTLLSGSGAAIMIVTELSIDACWSVTSLHARSKKYGEPYVEAHRCPVQYFIPSALRDYCMFVVSSIRRHKPGAILIFRIQF